MRLLHDIPFRFLVVQQATKWFTVQMKYLDKLSSKKKPIHLGFSMGQMKQQKLEKLNLHHVQTILYGWKRERKLSKKCHFGEMPDLMKVSLFQFKWYSEEPEVSRNSRCVYFTIIYAVIKHQWFFQWHEDETACFAYVFTWSTFSQMLVIINKRSQSVDFWEENQSTQQKKKETKTVTLLADNSNSTQPISKHQIYIWYNKI